MHGIWTISKGMVPFIEYGRLLKENKNNVGLQQKRRLNFY